TLTVRAADRDERHGPFLPKRDYEDEAQCDSNLSLSPLLKHYPPAIMPHPSSDSLAWGMSGSPCLCERARSRPGQSCTWLIPPRLSPPCSWGQSHTFQTERAAAPSR